MDAKIGCLYNPFREKLSYFVNGKFIGTSFSNVSGDLFICLEICHLGSFDIVEDVVLPEEEEYINLL